MKMSQATTGIQIPPRRTKRPRDAIRLQGTMNYLTLGKVLAGHRLPGAGKRNIQTLQLLPCPHGKVPVDVQANVRPEADQLGQILVP